MGEKRKMKKHGIIWYYILTLICTIVLGGIATTLLDATNSLQYALSLSIVQMSPLSGVILICVFNKDWSAFKKLHWNPFKYNIKIIWVILSVIIPITIVGGSAFVLSLMGKGYVSSGYSIETAVMIVLASVIGCFGEEIGWRGFLLPEFNKKYSLLLSAVFSGMLWGMWHIGKISLYGLVGYLFFVLMITGFTVIMAWIYQNTNGNLILMIIFHLFINVSSMFLLTKREGIQFYILGCIFTGVFCLIAIVSSNRIGNVGSKKETVSPDRI